MKTTILSALIGVLILSSTAPAADVHVTCEAGYVTEFEITYFDPAKPVMKMLGLEMEYNSTQEKRLSLGFSHTFRIPNNATKIRVYGKTVNLIGGVETIDHYSYTNTVGIGDNIHYTFGTLFDPVLRKRDSGAPNGFEGVAIEMGKLTEKGLVAVGKGVVDVTAEFGEWISTEVLIPMGKAIVEQHGDMIKDARQAFETIGREHVQDLRTIEQAINEGDAVKALGAVGNLIANSAGFRKMITEANEENMGSIVFFASGGGGVIVGGDVAVGNAFDVATLVYMANNGGQLPPNNGQAVMASFTSVGFSIGASIGGGANVAVGYDTSSAKDISEPSVDLTVDGAFGLGGNATLSWDPSAAMKFGGFTVGLSGGVEVEASAGVSLSTKVSSLTVGDIKRLRGR